VFWGKCINSLLMLSSRGAGKRLKETPDMFSGLIWTGAEGIKLGLADGLGDARYVAEEVIGAKKLVDFNPEENFLDRMGRRLRGIPGPRAAGIRQHFRRTPPLGVELAGHGQGVRTD
jgi:ClpP class serine protease